MVANDGGGGGEQSESLGAKVTPEFKQKVRIIAAHKGISMSEYVRGAVEDAVEEDLDRGDFPSPATASS